MNPLHFGASWIAIIFLTGIVFIEAQNCGFPSRTVTVQPVVEDTAAGTILENLRIVNIEDQAGKQPCNADRPNDPFISWVGSKSKKALEITLLANLEPLIDEYKLLECLVEIKMRCTDGRWKILTLLFPLQDINSKAPVFVNDSLVLSIELPWNCMVPLNFELNQIIEVKDQDRDLENARITFRQLSHLQIFYFILEPNSDYVDENMTHTFPLKLYLTDCSGYTTDFENQSFSTTLYVYNTEASNTPHPWNNRRSLTIQITFSLSESSYSRIYYPPYFDAPIYQLSVNLPRWKEGAATGLQITARHYAYGRFLPSLYTITYSMDDEMGRSLFFINQTSGNLYYKTTPTLDYFEHLKHQVGIYQIKAERAEYLDVFSIINLVVYFDLNEGTTSTEVYDIKTDFDFEIISDGSTAGPTETHEIEYTSPLEASSSTEVSSVTSTSVPENFRCKHEGWFADNEYCNVFHVCEEGGYGLIDHRFCCASAFRVRYLALMFCETTKACEHEIFSSCTCSTGNYGGDCF